MKKLFIIIFFTIWVLSQTACAEQGQYIDKQKEVINLGEITSAIDKMVSEDSKEIVPEFNIKKIIKDLTLGNVGFNIKDILNRTIKYFFKEVHSNLHIIIKVVVLVLLCALLQNLQAAFGREGVGEVAFYSCYIFIAAILIKSFVEVLNMGKSVIENLVLFMQAFIPTIFTLLISTGNITTSAVLQPSIIFTVEIMGTLIKNFILPLILFYTVLAIINNISNKVQVSKLADFIKSIGMWSMGILLTIFIGIVTLQSKVTSIADGVGTKTAKFAVSTFIPVVGKILSDAVDTVIGYSILLKNSISIVGMIVVILICLIPIIKLFALIVIYKLTAAMIQPISDERIVKCISEMANSLTFVCVTVISVSVMFIITVSIVMSVGNTALMMR